MRTYPAVMLWLLGTAFSAAQAATISKSAGATTPVPSDFSSTFNAHPNKVGYGHAGTDGMFLETFHVRCNRAQRVVAAKFNIQLRKLSRGPNAADNDGMAFWDNGNAIFNTYLWTAADPVGATRTVSLDLSALPPASGAVLASPGNGLGLLSDGDFSFSVQDDTSVLSATLDYECGGRVISESGGVAVEPGGLNGGAMSTDAGSSGSGGAVGGRKGMTWGVYPAHPVSGIATVACQGQPGGNCNAYQGDTSCSVPVPVLCMKVSGLPNPASNTQDPQHWSGNVIATTPAVAPASMPLGSVAQVNGYCAAQFGPGWVVADFHAGSGWKFGAYGNVGQPGRSRFWVNIRDQPAANCWSQ